MNTFPGKTLAIVAVLLCAMYLGYRAYDSNLNASVLRQETLEAAVETVAIVSAKPADPNDTITLPGTIQAWFEAPIYAQVSGYVKMWYKDYGAQVKEGDILAEIETDKATMEVEAVDEGKLGKILVPGGTENVKVNTPIALILEEGESAAALAGAARLGTEFLPTLEENNLWVRVQLPNSVDLEYSAKVSKQIRDLLRSQPEVAQVTVARRHCRHYDAAAQGKSR